MPRRAERLRRLAPPLLLGAAGALGFAPVDLFPLVWVSLAGLYLSIRSAARSGEAGQSGFAWGLGFFLTGVSWVYVSMHDFGGMPAALAVLATLLFCAYLALFPAAVALLWRSGCGAGTVADALLFAGLWAISEWLRGVLFSGFPWLAVGYSQTPPSPLAGFASLFGVYGVSLTCALVATALAALWPRTSGQRVGVTAGRRVGLPLAVVAALLVAGGLLGELRWTRPAGAPLTVALLQGNVPQSLKWVPERFAESLRTYYQLAREHPARLTILPETALPAFFDQLPPEYLRELGDLARRQDGDILFGSVVGDRATYVNGVVSIGSAPLQVYGKRHLVPFGEFIPPGFSWFLGLMQIPMSEFSRGAPGQPPLSVAGQRVAINICYEDLFGAELLDALPQAGILANVSNTAWFGRSWAQPQHLQIARVRALETGRPMLRATNTGMTAHITPDGRVGAVLPPFERGGLVVEVQAMAGETPFIRFGNALALALAVTALLPALPRWRKSPTPNGENR